MGDSSSIGITIFKDDVREFRSILKDYERELPTGYYDRHFDDSGNTVVTVDQANCGWNQELLAAAEAKLRFFGWDNGCVGAWAESEFCAIDGKIYYAITPCEFGPVVRLHRDGKVDEADVKSTMEFYHALDRVKKVMGL